MTLPGLVVLLVVVALLERAASARGRPLVTRRHRPAVSAAGLDVLSVALLPEKERELPAAAPRPGVSSGRDRRSAAARSQRRPGLRGRARPATAVLTRPGAPEDEDLLGESGTSWAKFRRAGAGFPAYAGKPTSPKPQALTCDIVGTMVAPLAAVSQTVRPSWRPSARAWVRVRMTDTSSPSIGEHREPHLEADPQHARDHALDGAGELGGDDVDVVRTEPTPPSFVTSPRNDITKSLAGSS